MLSDLLSNPTTMTKMIDLLLPELKNSFDSPSGSMEDIFSVSQDQALYILSYLVDNRSSSLSETSLVELIQVRSFSIPL